MRVDVLLHRRALALGTSASLLVTACSALKGNEFPEFDAASDGNGSADGLLDGTGDERSMPVEASSEDRSMGVDRTDVIDAGKDDVSLDQRTDSIDAAPGAADVTDAKADKAIDAESDTADVIADDAPSPDVAQDMSEDPLLDATEEPVVDANALDADVDAGEPAIDATCTPNCSHLGDFRCATDNPSVPRQIQVCSLARGCLEWLDTATCSDVEMCCAGACRPVGTTASCEMDYYVDAKIGVDDADGGINGHSPDHPFRTITFTLAEAQKSMVAGARIHVAAGRYDGSLGEQFPLFLRSGASLLGAGSNVVTIQGSGPFDHKTAGGSYDENGHFTMMVGDSTLPTTISGMTVRGDKSVAEQGYNGIICDRGSGPAKPGGSLAGLTVIDDVAMGPGYGFSVIAANSTVPARSACNLRMTRSRITGGWWGVIAMGFDWETASPLVASVQIGDETAGNSFEALTLPGNIGGALLVWSGVTNSSFRYNTVIDSAGGVVIDQRNEDGMGKNSFVINDNTFLRLSVTGVFLWSPTPVVEELNDNSFVDISGDHSGGAQPTAWAIAANGFSGVSDFPVIKKARRNQFIGNDVAIVLGDGTGVSFGSSGPLDFGRPDDPGGNVFRCNSKTSGAGGDLLVYVSGTGMAPFAGNVWDHFPPTTGPDPTAPNGTDIITYSSPPSIDTTNGTVGTEACPAGRVKGP